MSLESVRARGSKILCIGLNKTGTSSLHKAFLRLGLRSIHFAPERYRTLPERVDASLRIHQQMREAQEKGAMVLDGLDEYDAYLDIYFIVQNYPLLDRQYPGSKFVYTDRDTESWIQSRERHVRRNQVAQQQGVYTGSFVSIDIERWRTQKMLHERSVRSYFAGRDQDLLVMNVFRGDGFAKLCGFLGLEALDETFPWENDANTRDEETRHFGSVT